MKSCPSSELLDWVASLGALFAFGTCEADDDDEDAFFNVWPVILLLISLKGALCASTGAAGAGTCIAVTVPQLKLWGGNVGSLAAAVSRTSASIGSGTLIVCTIG
jgi:hypothetical protein